MGVSVLRAEKAAAQSAGHGFWASKKAAGRPDPTKNHNLLWSGVRLAQRRKKTLKKTKKVVDKPGMKWYFIKVPADGGLKKAPPGDKKAP